MLNKFNYDEFKEKMKNAGNKTQKSGQYLTLFFNKPFEKESLMNDYIKMLNESKLKLIEYSNTHKDKKDYINKELYHIGSYRECHFTSCRFKIL